MAEKAGGKHAPKTTVGPTRAAKGAGAGRNLRKPPEPKAKIPEPKKAINTPTPAPILNDDRTPEQRQRDFREANLLKLKNDHKIVENELAVLSEKTSEVTTRKKQIRAGIETLGYSLDEFDKAMKQAGSGRIDIAQQERMRTELREIFAVHVPAQGDLFPGADKMPEPARDAEYWELEGYRAGINAERMEPQDQNVPPDMWQDFLRGVANGQARNVWAGREADRLELERQTAEREKKAAAANADLADKAGASADVVEPSALELRRAAKAEETRARESLERMGSDASAPEVSDEVPDPVEDEFEAGDEELSAQRGRPSTIDATDPEPASAGTGEGEQIV